MLFSLTFFLARAGGGIGGGGHSSSSGGHISSGGSHFSSGGTHTFVGGGVSSGTSSGGGWIGALFIIPVIVIVLVLIYVAHRKSRSTRPSWPASGTQGSSAPAAPWPAPSSPGGEPEAAAADGLAAIKAHDPGFDEDAFLATVERCFFAVEEAWSQQRPELSRPVMSDEAWQRQKADIESYRSSGRRNVLDNLTVAKATIIAADSQDDHDVVTVRFRAASANYDVDLASGKVVHGNHQMAFWEQDWVFERSSQTSTDGDGGVGQRCPNCGAPLDLDIGGVCRNCRTAVRSGDGQWLVVSAGQSQHVPA